MDRAAGTERPPIAIERPRKKNSVRLLPGAAGGNVQRASGASLMVQMATSASGRAAHEWGGGAGGRNPSSGPATKQVTYDPWYYAYKHFGYYVKVGAKAVKCTTNGASPGKMCAFSNPNGDIILVVENVTSNVFALTTKVGNTMWKVSLPANSFNTVRMALGTAVKERRLDNVAKPMLSNARIINSRLSFTFPSSSVREMNVTLTDLEGRTVWTGNRGGNELQGDQQVFRLRSIPGGLHAGTYLLTVRVKNRSGEMSTVENKVSVKD